MMPATNPPNDERVESSADAREMPLMSVFSLYLGVTVIVAMAGVAVSGSNAAFEVVIRYGGLFFGLFLVCRLDRRLSEIRDELRKRG